MIRLALIACVLSLCGCATPSKPAPAGADHPANPDAPTGAQVTARAPAAQPDVPTHDHSGHGHAAPAEPTLSPQATYMCPMHPAVTSNDPEARCPECGMKINKRITPEAPR